MNQNNDPPDAPWGGGNKSLPDRHDVLSSRFHRFKKHLPSGSPTDFVTLLSISSFTNTFWPTFYNALSDSVAAIQRIGQYIKCVPTGFHLKFPMSIVLAKTVPEKRQLKQKVGFVTFGEDNPYQGPRNKQGRREKPMLAGDLNAARFERGLQYGISDPVKLWFEVRELGEAYSYVSGSVMRNLDYLIAGSVLPFVANRLTVQAK